MRTCQDCGRPLCARAQSDQTIKRCRPCFWKSRRLPRGVCQDCGKELSYAGTHKGAVLCKGCTTRRSWTGRSHSEESKIKISHAKKGQRPTRQVREKLSAMRRGSGNHFWGRRHSAESIQKMSLAHSGARHPCYRDGKSCAPYVSNWAGIRKLIRHRDDYLCQHPGCYVSENGKKHDCHHIDRDRNNNELANIILLCHRHHVATFFGNPDFWTEYYDSVQETRGIYKSNTEVTVMKKNPEGERTWQSR